MAKYIYKLTFQYVNKSMYLKKNKPHSYCHGLQFYHYKTF